MRAHLMESANSHIRMQFEEIQRLRRTIREKVLKKFHSNVVPSLITFSRVVICRVKVTFCIIICHHSGLFQECRK